MKVGALFATKMKMVLRKRGLTHAATYKQLDRIAKLPNICTFFFLHHEGICEPTHNLRDRLYYICREKYCSEIYQRLFCIRLLKPGESYKQAIPNHKAHITVGHFIGTYVKGTN